MMGLAAGLGFLLQLGCYLGYVCCVSRFLMKHLCGEVFEKRAFGGLLFFSYAVIALFAEGGGISYILYALLYHVLFVVLAAAVFRRGRAAKEKKVLAAVMLMAVTELIQNFGESFLSCLGLMIIHGNTGGEQMAVISVWTGRMILMITYAAEIAAIHLLSRPMASVFEEKRKSWYFYLTVPFMGIVLIMDCINWAASNGIMVQNWEKYGLYENQLFSHGAMCIFTGLAMAGAGFFVFGMDRIEREEKRREQYELQVMYFQGQKEQYERMERLRHDLKNHMLVLENLVQNRQWERAGTYLQEITKAGGMKEGEDVTGNFVMDVLLYHKKHQAAAWGIYWQCDARLPEDCPIKETDLCIIAGNILDNAIEACCRIQEKEGGTGGQTAPFIQIYFGTVKQCLLLEVRNSTDLADGQAVGKSRKKDSEGHGLGLANIKAAAARYHGTVYTEVKKGIFTMSVLLPLCRENHM